MAEEDNDESPIKKKSSGGIGLVLQGVNTVLTAGVLAAVLLKGGGAGEDASAGAAASAQAGEGHGGGGAHGGAPPAGEEGALLPLDDFVVRLRNPEKERYLRMTVQVELTSKEELAKVQPLGPRARDIVLAYLSDRSFEELRGSRGLEDCKAAIAERLTPLYGKSMRGLYITNFIMQ